jgi:hypothetical protein
MGEFGSPTYSLSNDGRNASVVMSAVENVPETKCFWHPPQAFGHRDPSPLPLSFGKYPQEELRFAGGARRRCCFASQFRATELTTSVNSVAGSNLLILASRREAGCSEIMSTCQTDTIIDKTGVPNIETRRSYFKEVKESA